MIKLIIYLYLLPPTPISIQKWCGYYDVHHSEIVIRQAILETGHFTSYNYRVRQNLFGLTKYNGEYFKYDHWSQSILGYKTKLQYKYRPEEFYYDFLNRIGYARSKNYNKTLKKVLLFKK